MPLFRSDLTRPPGWPPPKFGSSQIDTALQYARQRDPLGHTIHTTFAVLFFITLPFSTFTNAIATILLYSYAILRLHATWPAYSTLLRRPTLWIVLAFASWTAISLTWSPDPSQGASELWSWRMMALPLALWPVLHNLPLLIGSLLLGIFIQNCCQFLQFFDLLPLSRHHQDSPNLHRYGGFMYFIQTGAWSAVALAFHTVAILFNRDKQFWISLLGLIAATIGLIASGSRGAWIATLIIPLGVILITIQHPTTRRPALILATLALIATAISWPYLQKPVISRIEIATTEAQQALDEQNYESSVGLRIGLWRWAWQMYKNDPLQGTGAGGYLPTLDTLPLFTKTKERVNQNPTRINWHRRNHAHSSPFHILATLGTPGIALFLTLLLLLTNHSLKLSRQSNIQPCPVPLPEAERKAVRESWSDRHDLPRASGRGTELSEIAITRLHLPSPHPWLIALPLVLATWIIGSLFDCYHLNGNLVGLLAFIITITIAPSLKMPTPP